MAEILEFSRAGLDGSVAQAFRDELLSLNARLGPNAHKLAGFGIILFGNEDLTSSGSNVLVGLCGTAEELMIAIEALQSAISAMQVPMQVPVPSSLLAELGD